MIAVCGSAGFIGGHLVDRLLADGQSVMALDDLSEGKYLPKNPNLEFHQVSVLDDISKLFRDAETVFHLAALPRPQLSIADPLPAHKVNVDGLLNVLMACKLNRVKRLVFVSSACVYGEQPTYPSKENAVPNPQSPYSLHKLIGEYYCHLFTNLYGLETVSLRCFNVYGNRMNPNGFYASLIPKFIKLIKAGEQPTIFGNGKQARDFVHVSDVVEALCLAAKTRSVDEVFNIGSGKNYSVNAVFELICSTLNKQLEPLYGPAMVEPTQTLAEISKAKVLLKWQPKISLEQGIEQWQA